MGGQRSIHTVAQGVPLVYNLTVSQGQRALSGGITSGWSDCVRFDPVVVKTHWWSCSAIALRCASTWDMA